MALLSQTHGMAIESHLIRPVSGAADFRDVLLAKAESPPKAPKPTTLEQFIATHPTVPLALAMAQTPDSFADEYFLASIASKNARRAGGASMPDAP
jgi:catalase